MIETSLAVADSPAFSKIGHFIGAAVALLVFPLVWGRKLYQIS